MSFYFDFVDKEKLDNIVSSGQFPFSKYLFWDAAIESIDIKKNKFYIIERVLSRGKLEDFYVLLKLYDLNEIKDGIYASRSLDPKTVNFCSTFFNIPKSQLYVSSFYR
jgi:hypothetical protein